MTDHSAEQQARPMTVDDAEKVASWRYSGDWSLYNLQSAQSLIDELASYHSIVIGEKLVGFYCLGKAARVAGMTEDPTVLDLGVGLEPLRVGRGHGAAFGRAVLCHLLQAHPDQALRAVVQTWNERSLRLTRRLGFEDAGELTVMQDGRPVAYRVLVKRS